MDPNRSIKRRVMIYELAANGDWESKGKGYIQCKFVESYNSFFIIVKSEEEDEDILLHSKILIESNIYQIQKDTLIIWREPDGLELALSFQESTGRNEIWQEIVELQKRQEICELQKNRNGSQENSPQKNSITIELPKPNTSNLADVQATLENLANDSFITHEVLTNYILKEKYVEQLIEILDLCEDMEDESLLHHLFNIMKTIVLLNDSNIFDYITQDSLVFSVVAMFENDPAYPHLKPNHRENLKAKYKEPIEIKDETLKAKIHQTFRLQYFKDVALARIVHDATYSLLNQLIYLNQLDIIRYLQLDNIYCQQIFSSFSDEDATPTQKDDIILLLQELCVVSKGQEASLRYGLMKALCDNGLLIILGESLSHKEYRIRSAVIETLVIIIECEPCIVRSFILSQEKEKDSKKDNSAKSQTLLRGIIFQFLAEDDMGIKSQLIDAMRMLLEVHLTSPIYFMDRPNANNDVTRNQERYAEGEEFLNLFYGPYVRQLMDPLITLDEKKKTLIGPSGKAKIVISREESNVCGNLCDLLVFLVAHHTYRSKYFILGSNISLKVASLLKIRDKWLQLASLRYFKACVALNDDFHTRYLLKNNLIEPIVNLFLETSDRYNLINSACLDLFESIEKSNIKDLVAHIEEHFYEQQLKPIEYVDTFTRLHKLHEKNTKGDDEKLLSKEDCELETNGPSSSMPPNSTRSGWNSKTLDEDEEAYFNESEEEDTDSGQTKVTSVSSTPNKEESENGISSNSEKEKNSSEPHFLSRGSDKRPRVDDEDIVFEKISPVQKQRSLSWGNESKMKTPTSPISSKAIKFSPKISHSPTISPSDTPAECDNSTLDIEEKDEEKKESPEFTTESAGKTLHKEQSRAKRMKTI